MNTIDSISCVGFIMDGNRRWAKERSLPTLEGHTKGTDVFIDIATAVHKEAIPHAVFYAFSTENWQRTKEEVSYLMDLFVAAFERVQTELNSALSAENRFRVRFIGDRTRLPASLLSMVDRVESQTVSYTATTLWIALSYGGRDEIVRTLKKMVAASAPVDEVSFAAHLDTADMPDPDLIIRTGGDQRLSNFMTWQSAYSELFFLDTYWPAFTPAQFHSIVEQYGDRQRRKGK